VIELRSSVLALHLSSTRSGPCTAVAVRSVGAEGGMKSALGRPPLSAPQSTVAAFASEIAWRKPARESFGVRSAQKAPDCQPASLGSSKSKKLK
jgi:hypothetical protein